MSWQLWLGGGAALATLLGLLLWQARRAGRQAERAATVARNLESSQRVTHAIVDAPRDPAALADRLRHGRGL